MSDFGAAARLDWTLRGTPFEAFDYKWGLPFLPHTYEAFSGATHLPSFEVCLDRLRLQEPGSVDRAWAKRMATKTDVCLHSRLFNLAGEAPFADRNLAILRECVTEVSPRWVAFAVGASAHHAHSLQIPMPVPRTKEVVERIACRVRQLQDLLGREIALTNVPAMFRYSFDSFNETEFWQQLTDATGAKIFLDIPAYYVSLLHQDLDFEDQLTRFPLQHVMSVRVGALALSAHGPIDAECGRLSVTHWGLLEDVLRALPQGQHKSIFLKWFEPLVEVSDLINEVIHGQTTLRRLGEI